MTIDANANNLVWDIDNHLQSFNTVTFTYDALGRRLEKKTASGNTLFICKGQRVVEEYEDDLQGGGYTLARSYTHASYVDDIVAKIETITGTTDTLYYHSDRQFNVRGISDDSITPNVVETYAYTPYGKHIVVSSTATTNNSYGYTGRYLDSETELWYFRARYFDDEMGRFISRDPLGYVDGMSLYNGYFAQGFALDPSGLLKITNIKGNSKKLEIKYEYENEKVGCDTWVYIDNNEIVHISSNNRPGDKGKSVLYQYKKKFKKGTEVTTGRIVTDLGIPIVPMNWRWNLSYYDLSVSNRFMSSAFLGTDKYKGGSYFYAITPLKRTDLGWLSGRLSIAGPGAWKAVAQGDRYSEVGKDFALEASKSTLFDKFPELTVRLDLKLGGTEILPFAGGLAGALGWTIK